jgi:hypothetical protein
VISVYALTDPRTDMVHYVGRSRKPPARLYLHISEAKNNWGGNAPVSVWIRDLLAHGYRPELVVLEMVPDDVTALKRVEAWRLHYRGLYGMPLFSHSNRVC